MPRHELPRRTEQRLAVAGVTTVAIIGTTVTVGIMGIASARNTAAPTRCLPVAPPAPPTDTSAPAETVSFADTFAPAESALPAESEQSPADQLPVEQPPADPGTRSAENPASEDEGLTAPAGAQSTGEVDVPRGSLFVLDVFPDEKHSPVTDHRDFVDVMPQQLINRVVGCINQGRRC